MQFIQNELFILKNVCFHLCTQDEYLFNSFKIILIILNLITSTTWPKCYIKNSYYLTLFFLSIKEIQNFIFKIQQYEF